MRTAPLGFSKLLVGGHEWRLFAVRLGPRLVVTAQLAEVRNIAARRITLRILTPTLAVIPLASVMILLAVAFGLRPLIRITEDLHARSHRDLSPL
ncbi:MAG TPA: hypothetical protein VKT22_11930, partial [Steroidobacteraceae bacterium]|nr:hypothetical protein [Steroidobacteraceae bacterium]